MTAKISIQNPIGPTPRKRLTPSERSLILDRQNDLCADCSETLVWAVLENPQGTKVYGPMIDEHIIPIWTGGSNDLSNRELRCVPCAKKKTRKDKADIAKTKRIIGRHTGEIQPKGRLKGPDFSKTHRRKMNGSVEVVK